MLSGKLTCLRARAAEDVEILHAELYEDVAVWTRADTRPWVPIPSGQASPYWVSGLADDQPAADPADTDSAVFSVVERATGGLAGEAVVWSFDLHNRSAHLGISLRPAFRGRGFGVDVVRILCRYGFQLRGLHRLQLETLGDNHAMMAVAEKAGFTREGMTRGSSWVNGRFCDDVIFGLLAEEFTG